VLLRSMDYEGKHSHQYRRAEDSAASQPSCFPGGSGLSMRWLHLESSGEYYMKAFMYTRGCALNKAIAFGIYLSNEVPKLQIHWRHSLV